MAFAEYDYDGDMDVFERRLRKAGITKEEFDITNYVGLTYRELSQLTNSVIAAKGNKGKTGNA